MALYKNHFGYCQSKASGKIKSEYALKHISAYFGENVTNSFIFTKILTVDWFFTDQIEMSLTNTTVYSASSFYVPYFSWKNVK